MSLRHVVLLSILIVCCLTVSCDRKQTTALDPVVPLVATIDTIDVCCQSCGFLNKNSVVQDDSTYQKVIQAQTSVPSCSSLVMPAVDFRQRTLVLFYAHYTRDMYAVPTFYVRTDSINKRYECVTEFHRYQITSDLMGSYVTLLVSLPKFDPTYTVEFIRDTIIH